MGFRSGNFLWGVSKNSRKVRVYGKVYESFSGASASLGRSPSYIATRLKHYSGVLPDGTKIELIKEDDKKIFLKKN